MTQLSPGRPLASDRLARRREHLMTEITELASSPLSPNPAEPRRTLSVARWSAVAAAVAALVVGIGVVASSTGGPTGHGPAAFAIEALPSGGVSIRVVNTRVAADDMTAQLRAVGLNIDIDTAPASPQLVGRWLVVTASEDVPGRVADEVAAQTLGSTATLEVRKRFPGELTLTVGRSPEPGEDVQVAGTPNALAPGGLLYCQRLAGQAPATADAALTAAGYTVTWAGRGRRPLVTAPSGSRVAQAYIYDTKALAPAGVSSDGKTVQVVVWDPTDPQYEQILWAGWPQSASRSDRRDYDDCPAG
jgi:hypothetical protein